MKTKIGLPFGLALVVFIGVFTTMLALGALNPQPAEAQFADLDGGQTLEVTVSNNASQAIAMWTFMAKTDDANTLDADDDITIQFPSEFTTSDADEMTWSISGVAGDITATESGGTVTLDIPVDETIAVETEFTITATPGKDTNGDDQGIVNPTFAAEDDISASYEITLGSNDSAYVDVMRSVMIYRRAPQNVEVTNTPDEPGAAASIRVTFTTETALTANIDQIKVRFDKDIGAPLTLAENHVLLVFDDGESDTPSGEGQATPLSTAPDRRVVDTFGEPNETPGDPNIIEFTLTVPDMDIAENAVGNITSGSEVTIVFSSAAGFTNPREASTGDDVSVGTSRTNYFSRSEPASFPSCPSPSTT
jgi:hypothetical protein